MFNFSAVNFPDNLSLVSLFFFFGVFFFFVYVNVVVQFYPWLNFYFPFRFLYMLMYDNVYKTKKKKN